MNIKTARIFFGYVFLIPSGIFVLAFFIYPIINSVLMSFTDWSGFSNNYMFVGLKNYIELLTNKYEYWEALLVNFKFALISTLLQTIFGFFLAALLYFMTKRWQNFFKVALYLPVILPSAAVGVMWTFIYNPEFGLINQFLGKIGLSSLQKGWLGEYSTALGCIIVTNTWRFIGITMVLYFISMLAISREVIEAATVDGAGRLRIILSVFLPLTWASTEINFILSIIGGMKAFDLFFLMTGGGPGNATQVTAMVIYRTAFVAFRFSEALSMSLILFICILFLTVLSRRLLKQQNQ